MTQEDFEGMDIKRELWVARSQPSDEFLARLTDRVRHQHPRPKPTPRLAIAFAATVAALAVAAAFGGISEAATAVSNAVTSIVHVGTPSKAQNHGNATSHGNPAPNAGPSSSGSSGGSGAHAGGSPPSPPGGASPPGGGSASSSQYCPPFEIHHGPPIACRWPPPGP